jgi:hypothetical protein
MPPEQLQFQLLNTAGGTATPNAIYLADDPAFNQVAFQIRLSAGATTLSPGTIPDPLSPPNTGTTLYLDLSALQLAPQVWAQLRFTADSSRTFKTFPHSVVGKTPTRAIDLAADGASTISIRIDGIVVPHKLVPPVQLYVMYYNVPQVAGSTATLQVAILPPPDGNRALFDDLQVTLYPSDGTVVNSIPPTHMAANRFTLQLASRSGAEVLAGSDTVFQVSLVYGKTGDTNGFGALTDVTRALQINAAAGTNAQSWTITPNRDAQSPYWTLNPPANAPILGSDAQAVVEIDFSNVVTTYQPGPTALLLTSSGVPGYRDSIFELVLNKVAHAVIDTFSVAPNPVYLSEGGTANVMVTWSASGAVSLELTQEDQGVIDVTGRQQVTAVLAAEQTLFTLKAVGAQGSVENVDEKTIFAKAIPLPPTITRFDGTITPVGSGPPEATFHWETTPSDTTTCTLSVHPGVLYESSSPPEGVIVTNAGVNFGVTLTATRKEKTAIAALSPTWQLGSSPVPIPEIGPDSTGITLANSGKLLYLGASNGIVVLSATGPAGSPWVRSGYYPVNGSYSLVTGVAISADDSQVYVAMIMGTGATPYAGAVQVFDASTLQPIGSPVPVADGPISLALDPNGQYLYVSCTPFENQIDILSVNQTSTTPLSKVGSFTTGLHETLGSIAVRPSSPTELWQGTQTGYLLIYDITADPANPLKKAREGELGSSSGTTIVGLAFAPDGERFIAAIQDNETPDRGWVGTHDIVDFTLQNFGPTIPKPSGLAVGANAPDIYTVGVIPDDNTPSSYGLNIVSTVSLYRDYNVPRQGTLATSDRAQHIAAFNQIADLLRAGATASARALVAHRRKRVAADIDRQLEHTLDRLAWLYGRGTYENLSTTELFQTAISAEMRLARELSRSAHARARPPARARHLVDAARSGVRLHVFGVQPVELWRGVYVEPLRPEFERRLRAHEEPFIRWRDGAVVVLAESELGELRTTGASVYVLFLDSDELLDLEGRGNRAMLEAELVRRLAIAFKAPDHVGDSRQDYLLRRLLEQSTVLRNLRDRLAVEHQAAHRACLSILASHRALLIRTLAATPHGQAVATDPLQDAIDREHELYSLATRWANARTDAAGLLGRFKAVAEAGTRVATLERHRR